jgi:hypothetical protein
MKMLTYNAQPEHGFLCQVGGGGETHSLGRKHPKLKIKNSYIDVSPVLSHVQAVDIRRTRGGYAIFLVWKRHEGRR